MACHAIMMDIPRRLNQASVEHNSLKIQLVLANVWHCINYTPTYQIDPNGRGPE